jgi:hypothetical protein
MHTKDRLAQALRDVGLSGMAEMAAQGIYDDYLSPFADNITVLVSALAHAAEQHENKRDAILALRQRAIEGDFDATREESEAWAASPEGQETMRKLVRDR